MRTSLALPAVLAVTLLGFAVHAGAEVQPQKRSSPEARLESVGKLIHESSAAKQIAASGNEQAMAKRRQAEQIYQQALQAHKAGDTATATRLLDKSAQTMFEAVRLTEHEKITEDKQRTDFQNRAQSLQALLDAYDRIAKEKRLGTRAETTSQQIRAQMGQAQSLYKQGDLTRARSVLDAAYVQAKQAIEDVRGGETLVRSLHFNSKEEEYRYELDRNDTHRMLLKVLVEQKGQSAGSASMRQRFVAESDRLRGEAERQAARGEYQAAIHSLEQSTKSLMQAIRSAGIYIPG